MMFMRFLLCLLLKRWYFFYFSRFGGNLFFLLHLQIRYTNKKLLQYLHQEFTELFVVQ